MATKKTESGKKTAAKKAVKTTATKKAVKTTAAPKHIGLVRMTPISNLMRVQLREDMIMLCGN